MNTSLKPAGAILSGILAVTALGTFVYSMQTEGVPQLLWVLAAITLALGAFCVFRREDDLVHDFFLPVLLFAALGGFTWAVRGSSGYGAVKGCIFAGVMWGAAWWYIARNPSGVQVRRYTSGWIVLALTLGIGLAGERGWMQWSSFFEGRLQTNTGAGEFVEISPTYGFIWLFIAGVPWAGLGACLLAWCAAERPLAAWKWAVRLFCGFGMAYFLNHLYQQHPNWFLPLYSSIEDRYKDLEANPNLRRLMNDNGNAIRHLGFYLGFLLFEIGRRDWRNVLLITTVGLLNGFGWALCQNWKWAPEFFGGSGFNWWRCWESSGGISIGVALGVAYYLVNRPLPAAPAAPAKAKQGFPWFGALSLTAITVPLAWFLVEAAGEVGREITSLPGAILTLFPIGHEGDDVLELFQLDHLAFTLALGIGVLLYTFHLWKKIMQAAAETGPVEEEVPALSHWFPRYLLLLAIAFFMMGWVRSGDAWEATVWWARYDYWFAAIALTYGVAYVLLYTFRAKSTPRKPRVSSFQRYPNIDWLATYLFLVTIAAAFLQEELPAWRGWFGTMQEETVQWYGVLGPAFLALFGIIYYLSALMTKSNPALVEEPEPGLRAPKLERLGVYLGLLVGLGMSLKNGTRGWANIYLDGEEHMWGDLYWSYIGPVMLVLLVLILLLVLFRRIPFRSNANLFPHAGLLLVLVVVVQNVLGQAITGPVTNWNEMAFNIYYFLLFLITAIILYHYHLVKKLAPPARVLDFASPVAPAGMAMADPEPFQEEVSTESSPEGEAPAHEEAAIESNDESEEVADEEEGAEEDEAGLDGETVDWTPEDPASEEETEIGSAAEENEEDTGPAVEEASAPETEETAEFTPEEPAANEIPSDEPVPAEPLGVSVMVDLDDVESETQDRTDASAVEDAGEEVLPGVPSPTDFDLESTTSAPEDSTAVDPRATGDIVPPATGEPDVIQPSESNPDDDHAEQDDPRFT